MMMAGLATRSPLWMSMRCEGQERRGLRNIWEKWRNPDRIHLSALLYMAIGGNMVENIAILILIG